MRDIDMRKQSGSVGIKLSKALTPLWKLSGGVGYAYNGEKALGEAKDLLTGLVDTTNTRDYSITYQGGSANAALEYFASKTNFGIHFTLMNRQRKHVENFPTKEVMEDDYLYFTSGLDFQTKFSPTANMKFNYSTNCELPPMEDSRAVIDDANPLSLKVGNNNLKLPRKHHFKLNLNQTFIESASAIEFKMEYQILNDFIAQRSRFFIQETYLPQYNYTVLQGATLYSVENSGTQQLLSGQLDYSTLSNFLKSSVKLAIGYTYEHTPAFAQEERNDWDRNQFLLNVGLISNFSRKIEISINSSTDLNRLKSKQSEASDMLNERVSLGVRTSIIPKFTLKATLSHSYYKQFTDNQQTNNTTLEASIARKLGKNIDFSLNGYNLLDSQKSETLLKTAEYTGFSRIATTGRCIMASLSYKF
jgi:hypothetical protein